MRAVRSAPDGQTLAFFVVTGAETRSTEIWMLPREGEQEPWTFLDTEFDESGAMFSPNGRWLAYMSNETGRDEIYVQPFGVTGGMHGKIKTKTIKMGI